MSEVTVQGGAGGIRANHADMRTTSGILAGVGVDLIGWSVSVGAIAETEYLQPGNAHDYARYIEGGRAVDGSSDPSVQAFTDSTAPFFDQTADATILDHQDVRKVVQ